MKIAFLGFGEAARAFHESLSAFDGSIGFVAWDILLDDENTAPAMRREIESRDVAVATDCAGLGQVDCIFSAITAGQSLIEKAHFFPLGGIRASAEWANDRIAA